MANNYQIWARHKDIPLDADKQLFSVDVIYFVMINAWPDLKGVLPREVYGTGKYRDRVFEAYTSTTREAVEHLACENALDVRNRFSAFLKKKRNINEEAFNQMKDDLAKEFSTNGVFDCCNLLKYAACLGLLAGHCYNHGVTEARRLATVSVRCALPSETFMNSDYWDELAAAAEKILGREEAQ